jgi:hypothetical protein
VCIYFILHDFNNQSPPNLHSTQSMAQILAVMISSSSSSSQRRRVEIDEDEINDTLQSLPLMDAVFDVGVTV